MVITQCTSDNGTRGAPNIAKQKHTNSVLSFPALSQQQRSSTCDCQLQCQHALQYSAASPCYDIMSFVPYQIDHTVTGAGKTIGLTKKRITFKFGFVNPQALTEGLSGSGCRGSEHEVVFILSLSSGKRNVIVDGREVHFSQAGSWERSFDFPFSVRVPGVGSVHARLIADSAPGAKPYDLLINGMSYFHFSKIYELGTPSMRVAPMEQSRGGYAYDELSAPPDERRAIAQAKLESMRDLRAQTEHASQPPAPQRKPPEEQKEVSLISFDDDPAQPPPQQVPSQQAFQSPPMEQTYAAPAPSTASYYQNYTIAQTSQQYPTNSYGVDPYGAQQQYAQPPAPAAYASTPSYAQAPAPYSQYPASYSQPPPLSAYGNQQRSFPVPQAPTMNETSAPQQQSYSQQSYSQQSYPQQSYSQQPPSFASPQSQASYGSAPGFAQPSQANAPAPANYGAYPNQPAW